MNDFWKGKRVLVTGHTGFKGGWLCMYLKALGAEVYGYGLGRTSGPSFYEAAGVQNCLVDEFKEDILDLHCLLRAISVSKPEIIFHLAARAVVCEGLTDPHGTTRINVMGTLNVCEAVRFAPSVKATVMVTTDKVYRNLGDTDHHYTEASPLGGYDPYGASKAACEMIVNGYRHTYGLHFATARSGNVCGGGDWGLARLIPNCIRAFSKKEPDNVVVYEATRPFLHVLDSIRGYIILARALYEKPERHAKAYNFGPPRSTPVYEVAGYFAAAFNADLHLQRKSPLKEAARLGLDSGLAWRHLLWKPRWELADVLSKTLVWYQAHLLGSDMELVTREQIAEHRAAAYK